MIITLSHQKGGSGASTVALMIAHATGALALDYDGQGSLTAGLKKEGERGSAYEATENYDLASNISQGVHGGMLLPSDYRLSRLANEPGMLNLGDIIRPFAEGYETTVIDTQGSRDNLTIGAAKAADIILLPVQLTDSDLHATARWIRILQGFDLGDRIRVIATRVDARVSDNNTGVHALESLGVKVLKTRTPAKKKYGRIITEKKLDSEILENTEALMEEIRNG